MILYKKKLFCIILFFLFITGIKAESRDSAFVFIDDDTTLKDSCISYELKSNHFILLTSNDSAKHVIHENRKLISAILAFPFPFGILGLHRIYLGTKPYMPFVYVGTLGGCFGILPLIDFICILIADDETLKSFANNPKVFMWSH